jgi:hypothetical protein
MNKEKKRKEKTQKKLNGPAQTKCPSSGTPFPRR